MNDLSADCADPFAIDSTDPQRGPLFAVPVLEQDELFTVVAKPKRREELTLTLKVLERIHARRDSRDFVAATDEIASGYRHRKGFSGPSLRRKYYAYRDANWDWRALIKNYKSPTAQPAEFVEFLRGLIESNPRSATAAINVLLNEIWPSGAHVPGYGTWQDWFTKTHPLQPFPKHFPRVYPDGWTVGNLRGRYAPTKAQRAIFSQGFHAAHRYLPVVKRDPSKLRPMEWIVIDDFELDTQVVHPGHPERKIKPGVYYVAGLMAMCVGTRKKLAWELGVQHIREEKQRDGTIKKIRSGLRAADVMALLYKLFSEHGLPHYQVTIICENATAAISPELELMLTTAFEGRIKVQRTAVIRHKTLANGFIEKGGAPWEKGWLESDFNYLWNQMAGQCGYKGSNERLNAPGHLAEARKYALKFCSQGRAPKDLNLPPEIIAELRLPFPSPAELETAFAFIVARSETRTQHRIQGFDKITEFVWPKGLPAPAGIDPHGLIPLSSLALIEPADRTQLIAKPRKESPLERWERLCLDHPRQSLSGQVLSILLLTPKRATYKSSAASFIYYGEGYSYLDDDGVLLGIPEGTKILLYIDFARPQACLATKENGDPLGVLRLLGGTARGVDITDTAAMDAARDRRRKIVQRTMDEVAARHLDENAELAAAKKHNARIVADYRTATADMPKAERIVAAVGEANERHQPKPRKVNASSMHRSSQGFADLAGVTDTPRPQSAILSTAEDDPVSFDDLS